MAKRQDQREAAIERMADHVLAAGLASASLRPLAAAAGTSDRMLLYYFADKTELLGAVLERIAQRLATALESAIPAGTRLDEATLRTALWAGTSAPELQPYMRVWLELAAGAARNEEPHRAIGGRIADFFLDWIVARLDAPEDVRHARAATLFATLEGAMLIDALGRREVAELAMTTN